MSPHWCNWLPVYIFFKTSHVMLCMWFPDLWIWQLQLWIWVKNIFLFEWIEYFVVIFRSTPLFLCGGAKTPATAEKWCPGAVTLSSSSETVSVCVLCFSLHGFPCRHMRCVTPACRGSSWTVHTHWRKVYRECVMKEGAADLQLLCISKVCAQQCSDCQ